MLDVLRSALNSADRVAISVSFLRYSGLGLIADDLKRFGERGGRSRFLTSTYMGITQPEALRSLREFKGVDCRVHVTGHGTGPSTGFHTKLYIFRGKQQECWVGSSNLSKGGLAANLEANLRHTGEFEIRCADELFDQLWMRHDTIALDDSFIASYAESLRASLPLPSFTWTPPVPLAQERNWAADTIEQAPRPNPAQCEALARLAALRTSGEVRACVIAAPGVGKTFLAAFDAQAAGAKAVLFLSHRLEHLTQSNRTFSAVFGNARSYGQLFDGRDGGSADIVFATIASASSDARIRDRTFDYVVVDEFHHAAAPSYRALLERLRPRFLLGLTATPERQDGADVLRLCDYNVAYEVRLVDAINRGWLLPFHYFGVADDLIDYAALPWRSGRFDPDALENALMVRERVDAMLQHCRERGFDGPRRATVGFCAGVRHAEYMARALNDKGIDAACVSGRMSVADREHIYRRFQNPNDSLEWLFVADVLNEGVDIPAINSIVFLRPTESATIFIQQLGRGLRLAPDCEVLTVLDFVGHHRTAWLALDALADRDAPHGPSTVHELDVTPPRACEIVLDLRTLEILDKIKKQGGSRRQACLDAYRMLKDELGIDRPYPVDLSAHPDMPSLGDVRSAWGSWLGLRVAAGDAAPWEIALDEDAPAFHLLTAVERDWQAQRVYGYAAVWGMCAEPADPERGYEMFFERFPRWRAEYKSLPETKVADTLNKKLGSLLSGSRITGAALDGIPAGALLVEIEGRLQYTLEKDYRLRHGGVLRSPEDLVLHRRYDRPDIVNHFGCQYDPARHNAGVLRLGHDPTHVVILTKLDTSGAIARHQYANRFDGPARFTWTSQNKQTRTNPAGREILEHREQGRPIRLFVQSTSHSKAVYCGEVDAVSAVGDAPMAVTFQLHRPMPFAVLAELGVPSEEAR